MQFQDLWFYSEQIWQRPLHTSGVVPENSFSRFAPMTTLPPRMGTRQATARRDAATNSSQLSLSPTRIWEEQGGHNVRKRDEQWECWMKLAVVTDSKRHSRTILGLENWLSIFLSAPTKAKSIRLSFFKTLKDRNHNQCWLKNKP